jgi:hypothetical protein
VKRGSERCDRGDTEELQIIKVLVGAKSNK